MKRSENPPAWTVIEDWPEKGRLHPFTPPTAPVPATPALPTERPLLRVNIYALCEPGTTNVRYIGKTRQRAKHTIEQSLKERLNRHLYTLPQKKDTYLLRWMRQLDAEGKKPDIILLDVGDENTWPALEMFHISAHRQAGFRLTNVTDGGEGCNGFKHTPEHLAYMSRTLTGRKRTPEQRAKMVEAHKKCPVRRRKGKMPAGYVSPLRGRSLSAETKQKIAIAATKRANPDKKVTKPCEQCGKMFTARTCAKRKYCSQACFAAARTLPRGRGQSKIRLCPICGDSFEAQGPSTAQKYCSRKCGGISRVKQVMRTCKHCGNDYSTPPSIHPTFCSDACRRSHNNKKKYVCLNCGIAFETFPSLNPLFCSVACRWEHKKEETKNKRQK